MLDTGVQTNHPDLKGNLWENTKDPSNGRDDDHNCATTTASAATSSTAPAPGMTRRPRTHVAGIIGARGNNDRGIAGLCWSVKIVAVRVLDADGRGTWSQEIAGIDYALSAGAKVINVSFGGPTGSELVREAIQQGQEQRRVAGGRRRQRRCQRRRDAGLPCGLPGQQHPFRRRDRQQGPAGLVLQLRSQRPSIWPRQVTGVASTFWHSDYAYMSGTSMAAPYVAAAAAMLRKEHSSWSLSEISSRLRKKGNALSSLKGKTASGKRLNVNAALG